MELKDIGLMKDIELEKLKSAWEAKSSLIGSIMSGAGSIAGAFIKKG
jgi:hypothetical protein